AWTSRVAIARTVNPALALRPEWRLPLGGILASTSKRRHRSFAMRKHLLHGIVIAAAIGGGLSVRGDDKAVREAAKTTEGSAALLETLKDKDPSVRLQAAQLLVQMGLGKATVPALVELLKAPQQAVRLEAAQLLKQMGQVRLKGS